MKLGFRTRRSLIERLIENFRSKAGQDFSKPIEWEIIESNKDLQSRLDKKEYVETHYLQWNNTKWGGLTHNYEMYTPVNFDTSGKRKYPVFLEVYAGPEFQKVQSTFKTGWVQVHFPAAYDAIVLSVDGRGSAFQGDKFMFSNYRALAQTERVDQTGTLKNILESNMNDLPYHINLMTILFKIS